jgi:hypothetical protein
VAVLNGKILGDHPGVKLKTVLFPERRSGAAAPLAVAAPKAPAVVNVEYDTSSYNYRRYGKPWIANVSFEDNSQGTFSWGDWIGRSGEAGILKVKAKEGDVVAKGQKDLYKSRNSRSDYYQVGPKGVLQPLNDKATAYRAWNAEQSRRKGE